MKAMTVKELIEELQKCNPDAPVRTDEDGGDVIGVDKGNPSSTASWVTIETP